MNKSFKTPILLLVYNRPKTTELVFNEIRRIKPSKLFISSDGPKNDKDVINCNKVRDIIKQIDWDCDVKTLFNDKNLGCKIAVTNAIDWFFENVENGIILEDDCLPSQSFFWYCQELLYKYELDERIMLISGFNKQEYWNPKKYDYFFSNLGGIWGWASWRRAWQYNDPDMSMLDKCIDEDYLVYLLGNKVGKKRAKDLLNAPKTSWAYPWGLSRHINNGLACVPSKNLIKNIGFNNDATHTNSKSFMENINSHDLELPIKHNPIMIPDRKYDELFIQDNFINKLINLIK